MKAEYCILERDPERSAVCQQSLCVNCGWNKDVEAHRKEILRQNGLTLCSDGLRRLMLHSPET